MSKTAKRNIIISVAGLLLSCVAVGIPILALQNANAKDETKDAVTIAVADNSAYIMLDNHARQLSEHSDLFAKNIIDHEKFTQKLSVYSREQGEIKQSQKSLYDMQERMENSQTTFQLEMRTDIKALIQSSTKANAWIENNTNK